MNKFFTFLILVSVISFNVVNAAETTTDCPMMREMNERSNPKANLDAQKGKSSKSKSGAISL
jgi:hypothetical protein